LPAAIIRTAIIRNQVAGKSSYCRASAKHKLRSNTPIYSALADAKLGVDLDDHFTDVVLADDALAWQTWVVKNLEEMIVSATHLPSPPKERIAKAISLCIDQVTEGTMNRFACLSGKRKTRSGVGSMGEPRSRWMISYESATTSGFR
jgi:hypothetical protein